MLLGENSINHTPKNTNIKLKICMNFDVKVSQKQQNTKFNNNSDRHKTAEVLVPFNTHNDSKIKTDEKYTFTKGNLVIFSINIKKSNTKKFNLNYESKNNG